MSDIEWLAKFLKYFLIMSSFGIVIIAIMWGYAIWKWGAWREIRSVKRKMKEGQKIMNNAIMIRHTDDSDLFNVTKLSFYIDKPENDRISFKMFSTIGDEPDKEIMSKIMTALKQVEDDYNMEHYESVNPE